MCVCLCVCKSEAHSWSQALGGGKRLKDEHVTDKVMLFRQSVCVCVQSSVLRELHMLSV